MTVPLVKCNDKHDEDINDEKRNIQIVACVLAEKQSQTVL
jgi:hypothetical protein